MHFRFTSPGRSCSSLGLGLPRPPAADTRSATSGRSRPSRTATRSTRSSDLQERASTATRRRLESTRSSGLHLLLPWQQLRQPLQAGAEGRAGQRRAPGQGRRELQAGDREAQGHRPGRPRRIRKRSYEYLIAAYGPEKLNDFSQAEPIARAHRRSSRTSPATTRRSAKLYEDQGRLEEAEAHVQEGHRGQAERPDRLRSAWPATTTARASSRRPWTPCSAGPSSNRTTPRRGTRSAPTTRTRSFRRASSSASRTPCQGLRHQGPRRRGQGAGAQPRYYEAVTYKNILLAPGQLRDADLASRSG